MGKPEDGEKKVTISFCFNLDHYSFLPLPRKCYLENKNLFPNPSFLDILCFEVALFPGDILLEIKF